MTIDLSQVKIFLRPGRTDLQKAVNGLSVMIERHMAGEPFSGNVYLFCNRERKLLKAVWWDRNGFWLSHRILWIRRDWNKRNSRGLKRKKRRGK
jgi:transposase